MLFIVSLVDTVVVFGSAFMLYIVKSSVEHEFLFCQLYFGYKCQYPK
jgi:hypothetical protein